MQQTSVTIKDMARQLGISKSTVSRALRNTGEISPETRQKVIDLAQKLDYNPDPVALSLLNSRSNTVAVVVPDIANQFFAIVISGIEEVAYNRGYNVMIYQSHDQYQRELLALKHLSNRRADGLITSVASQADSYEHFMKLKTVEFPMVFFDRYYEEIDAPAVVVDDFEGAYQATKHLIEQGCKKIAHVCGPLRLNTSKKRLSGFKAAMTDFNMPFDENSVSIADYHRSDGFDTTKRLLERTIVPDGIFAASDNIALGCHAAIREMGYTMPDDIALIGFSDLPIDTLLSPQLSSIAQPAFEMGQVAVDLLIDLIEGKSVATVSQKIVLKTKLMARASTLRNDFLGLKNFPNS